MAIQVYCNCGNPIIVPANLGGRKVRCKVCDTVLLIPEVPGQSSSEQEEKETLAKSGDYEVVGDAATDKACPSCGALAAPGDMACLSCGADLGARKGKIAVTSQPLIWAGAGVLLLLLVGLGGYRAWLSGRPGSYCDEALAAFDLEDFPRARASFSKALEYDPHFPQAVLGLAELAIAEERPHEVRLWVPQALQLSRDDLQLARFHLAWARNQLGDGKWMAAYNSALEAREKDSVIAAQASAVQGLALLGSGKQEEALVFLLEARKASEDYRVFVALTGLLREGEPQQALECAERAAKLRPDDPALWIALADQRHENGKPRSAIQALEKSLALEPDNAEAHSRMANLHLQSGKLDSALRHARNARRLDTENLPPVLALARVLLAKGQEAEALQELLDGSKLGDSWELHFLLGAAYAKTGDLRQGLGKIKKALHSRKHDLPLHLEAGQILLETGEARGASDIFKAATALDANNYDAHLLYARSLTESPGGTERSGTTIVAQLEAAMGLDPRRIEAPLQLGIHYLDVLKPKKALAVLARGLQKNPGSRELRYMKGRAAVSAESWQDAIDALEPLNDRKYKPDDVEKLLNRAYWGLNSTRPD